MTTTVLDSTNMSPTGLIYDESLGNNNDAIILNTGGAAPLTMNLLANNDSVIGGSSNMNSLVTGNTAVNDPATVVSGNANPLYPAGDVPANLTSNATLSGGNTDPYQLVGYNGTPGDTMTLDSGAGNQVFIPGAGTDTTTGGNSGGGQDTTVGGADTTVGGNSGGSGGTSGGSGGTSVNVDYDRVNGLLTPINTGVTQANTALGTIGTDVGDLKTNLGTVGTNVTDVQNNVNAIKTDVGGLGTTIGNFRTAYDTGLQDLKGLFGDVRTDLSGFNRDTAQNIENLSKDTKSGFAQAVENREDIQAQVNRELERQRNIASATQNMMGNQGGRVSTQQPIATSGGPKATLADTSRAAQAINAGANSVRIPQGIINSYAVDPRDQITPVQMASGGIVGNIPANNLDKSMNSGITMSNTQPGIMAGAMPQPKPQDPLAGLRRLMNRGKKKVA